MRQKFLTLIEEHKGIIFKVCNMYCSHEEDRKDLFQDIVLQLWRSFPSFSNASKVTTWMYRIALNVSITRLRKEGRKDTVEALSEEAFAIPDEVRDDEEANMLHQAIELLSDVEKAIIMLYMDDCNYKEIGELVGITESNVGYKLNKIRTKLKTLVKKA